MKRLFMSMVFLCVASGCIKASPANPEQMTTVVQKTVPAQKQTKGQAAQIQGTAAVPLPPAM